MLEVHCKRPVLGDQESREPGFGETLAAVYDRGADWDRHKAAAQNPVLVRALQSVLGYRYSGEVVRCSTVLTLQRKATGELGVRPFESCRRRWCPVCSWRRSLKTWAQLTERLPGLLEQNGPVRWLLLTLTVRNCSIDELPATLDAMTGGWRRLINARGWPATAWVRGLEITFPRSGEAHPHFHALLAVKPSYFTHGYVPQAEWVRRWKHACRLDYDPVVDVRRVKPLSPAVAEACGDAFAEAMGGLREVSKYVTKPADLGERADDAVRGLAALKNRRFIDSGGWLRGVLKDDGPDEQLNLPEVEDVATFWWRAAEAKYRRKV